MISENKLYRPSNSTEGMDFIATYCENCIHEKYSHTMNTIDENIKRLISSISCMLLAEDIDPYLYDRDACIKKISRCVSPTLLKRVFMENEDAIIEQMKLIKG